jgi:hypothetical protein
MQKLVANSAKWAAGRTNSPKNPKRREAGPKATAQGPYKEPAH